MEKSLYAIFDYQRFRPAKKLEKLIDECHSRYADELGDDMLELVSAAGDAGLGLVLPEDDDNKLG